MTPKRFYIGLLKEIRQIVLQAVGSLPHKLKPNDPQLAREVLHDWAHRVFMRQMNAGLDSSGTESSALNA